MPKYIVAIAISLLLLSCNKQQSVDDAFETSVVGRSTITNSVTATGKVEPVNSVDVGTQVSGIIEHLYVDYNSEVKAGQIIAELDKTTLQADLMSAESNLASNKAELVYQEANYNRTLELYNRKVISDADLESAVYSYEKAKAAYSKSEADIVKIRKNLSYATIYSPISGIVLYRAVEEGQTVASSFNTPTLFTIAKDLTNMRVIADVDEADIGNVKEGLSVEFSVDAFPDAIFNGTVSQVRLQASTSSNVVTYEVVIDAPNKDLKLKPGMTANVTIITSRVKDAIAVPTKAFSFKPSLPEPPSDFRPDSTMMPPAPASATAMPEFSDGKVLFVKDGDRIHPVPVEIGITDGSKTEIKSGLSEGDTIIVSQISEITSMPKPSSEMKSGSPFMPSPPGRRK